MTATNRLDDGRKWGKDKVSITLTCRQWIMLCHNASMLTAYRRMFSEDYFTQYEINRAVAQIEKQMSELHTEELDHV